MIVEIFKEDSGRYSMTRVIQFLGFLVATALAVKGFWQAEALTADKVEIIAIFIGFPTTAKVIQKFTEAKGE